MHVREGEPQARGALRLSWLQGGRAMRVPLQLHGKTEVGGGSSADTNVSDMSFPRLADMHGNDAPPPNISPPRHSLMSTPP